MSISVAVMVIMGALGFCLACWAMHRLDCQETVIEELTRRVEQLEQPK